MSLIKQRDFYPEFVFSAVRSSGAGGQNVNKVSSKVELRLSIVYSQLLSDEEKEIIAVKLKNRINNEGELFLSCQTERTQIRNREKVIEKFYLLLQNALMPRKKRLVTKPSLASKIRRLETKRIVSLKKNSRKKDF